MPDDPEDVLEARLRRLIDGDDHDGDGKLDAFAPLHEEVGRAAQEAKESGQAHDDEIEARLADLEKRASAAKRRKDAIEEEERRRRDKDASSSQGIGVGMSIAYTILGTPMLGLLIGWVLDRRLGTTYWTGVCVTLGATAGVLVAIHMMNRANRL